MLDEEDADEMDMLSREMKVTLASCKVYDHLTFGFPYLFYFS